MNSWKRNQETNPTHSNLKYQKITQAREQKVPTTKTVDIQERN